MDNHNRHRKQYKRSCSHITTVTSQDLTGGQRSLLCVLVVRPTPKPAISWDTHIWKMLQSVLETQFSHFPGQAVHFCASVFSHVEQGDMKTKLDKQKNLVKNNAWNRGRA